MWLPSSGEPVPFLIELLFNLAIYVSNRYDSLIDVISIFIHKGYLIQLTLFSTLYFPLRSCLHKVGWYIFLRVHRCDEKGFQNSSYTFLLFHKSIVFGHIWESNKINFYISIHFQIIEHLTFINVWFEFRF